MTRRQELKLCVNAVVEIENYEYVFSRVSGYLEDGVHES